MKKLLPIINIVSFVALVVLYILFFTCKSSISSGKKNDFLACDTAQKALLPIAYINVDSLLTKYEFAIEENEKLIKKQENSQLLLTQKSRKLEEDAMDFQRKLENNVYATRERAEQENNRLVKQQQELQKLEARLTNEYIAEQQKVTKQLNDTVNLILEKYNEGKGYQIILSNTLNDNILYAEDAYNITTEIINLLNSRYSKK